MPPLYKTEWQRMKNTAGNEDSMERLVNAIAFSFLDQYCQDLTINTDYLKLLCEIATSSENPRIARYSSTVIFKTIIEKLCDSFDESDNDTYRWVMAQIVEFCRKLPFAGQFNQKLSDFGMNSTEALVERSRRLSAHPPKRFKGANAKKVIVLSRVTIGADIAITSIVIRKLMKACPDAQFIIIGNEKLNELFGANRRIQIINLLYSKKETLLDRLMKWIEVVDIVEKESIGFHQGDIVLIDPDSRLSQLGLLPCTEDADYYYWNSRRILPAVGNTSFSVDTNRWLNHMIMDDAILTPRLWLKSQFQMEGREFVKSLKQAGAAKVIVVNFGVGGDMDKRVNLQFEQKVLSHILSMDNVALLLDKGVSKEEESRIDLLAKQMGGREVSLENKQWLSPPFPGAGLYYMKTSIGQIAGLIEAADGYIGYDSACQHIAAAVNTNCITVFVTKRSVRFINRWSSFGNNFRYTLYIDKSETDSDEYTDEALYRLAHLLRSSKFIPTS